MNQSVAQAVSAGTRLAQTFIELGVLQVGGLRLQASNLSKGIAQRVGCLAVQVDIGSETLNLSKCFAQRLGGLVVQVPHQPEGG